MANTWIDYVTGLQEQISWYTWVNPPVGLDLGLDRGFMRQIRGSLVEAKEVETVQFPYRTTNGCIFVALNLMGVALSRVLCRYPIESLIP